MKRSRIHAAFVQLAEFRLHKRLVLLIGHAKPHGVGRQHRHGQFALVHQLVHKHWQQALGLDRIRRKPLEERRKIFLQLAENPRGEAPEVHADRREGIQQLARLARADVADLAVFTELDLERLHNLVEVAVHGVAHAAGHRAVFGNGVLELIAHHGRLALGRQRLQFFIDRAERGHAVVVIRIDDGKRLVDAVARHEHRVHRAERLGALLGNMIEGRNAGEILECVIHLHLLGDAVAADGSQRLLHARLDDKNNLVKACANRVIDGILHQDFAIRAETVHLLVAAVTGTHTGRHNQKRSTHIQISSSNHLIGFENIIQDLALAFKPYPLNSQNICRSPPLAA